MSDIRVGRLRRLAKHLRSEHRVHKEFSFSSLAIGEIKKGNYCGSSGCAVGELPAVWPKEWSWKQNNCYRDDMFGVVHKSQNEIEDTDSSVIADFFSITIRQVQHLFYPYLQDIKRFGGWELGSGATAWQVAANIDAFIEKFAS